MKNVITTIITILFTIIAAPVTMAQNVCKNCQHPVSDHTKRANGSLACPTAGAVSTSGNAAVSPAGDNPQITDLHVCQTCGKPEGDHITFNGKTHCRSERVVGFIPDTLVWNDLILSTQNGVQVMKIPAGFRPAGSVATTRPTVVAPLPPQTVVVAAPAAPVVVAPAAPVAQKKVTRVTITGPAPTTPSHPGTP